MERQSQHAAKFIKELSNLVERLAASDIVVGSLLADYSSFGSWQLVVYKHGHTVRFTWDGRDAFLTVNISQHPKSTSPNRWKEDVVKKFDTTSDDAPFRFIENYLTTNLPA